MLSDWAIVQYVQGPRFDSQNCTVNQSTLPPGGGGLGGQGEGV